MEEVLGWDGSFGVVIYFSDFSVFIWIVSLVNE